MSQNALNPKQFGLPFSSSREREIGERLVGSRLYRERFGAHDPPERTRRQNVTGPLRPTQDYLNKDTVQQYAEKMPRRGSKGDLPTVVRHKGEDVIWTGHHRIAAARQRGQQTMTVRYENLDLPE